MLQLTSTVFFYVWMIVTLIFLWKIWRNSILTAIAAQRSAEAAVIVASHWEHPLP
jgi:hypothetical protein